MAPQAATGQDIAQHHRLISPGSSLQNPQGLYSIYSVLKFVLVHSHAKYWSGLSLFWWCLRRGDLDGTDMKYLNAVDQGKHPDLISPVASRGLVLFL